MLEYVKESEASATKAESSQQAAAKSEANAKASENAAKASETAAKTSETNAKASETVAAGNYSGIAHLHDDIYAVVSDKSDSALYFNFRILMTIVLNQSFNTPAY